MSGGPVGACVGALARVSVVPLAGVVVGIVGMGTIKATGARFAVD
jgi:hypothetical protein